MSDILDFDRDVIARSRTIPVLADFWAPWCGACKVLSPQLEILQERHIGEWLLAKINTENHPELSARYRISSIPTVKMFIDGKVAGEFTGAIPGHAVEQWLAMTLPSVSSRKIARATKLLDQGNDDEARGILEQLIHDEPSQHVAKVLLARAIVLRDPARAASLVTGIEPVGAIGELADAISVLSDLMTRFLKTPDLPESQARIIFLQAISALYGGYFDTALDHLLESLRIDRNFLSGYAREVCIAIFKYLGEEHQITRRYRSVFKSVMQV